MHTVSFTRNYTNIITFQYPVINRCSTLSKLIDRIPMIKPDDRVAHRIFKITSDGYDFQLTIILSADYIYIISADMGTRVYDYSHADEARESIKMMAHLMGVE